MRSTGSRTSSSACETRAVRVLVAMSGGVDSSVAAALPRRVAGRGRRGGGHAEAVGRRLRLRLLLGGRRRRRPAGGRPARASSTTSSTSPPTSRPHVVDPYVAGHAEGRTPNPCIECNRHLKFDRLLERADAARVRRRGHRPPRPGRPRPRRAVPPPAGRRRAQGPVVRAGHAGPGAAGPAASSRWGTGPRARSGPRPPGWDCARRPSPTARTCASSGPTSAGPGSWATGCRCTPAGSSTTPPGTTSAPVEAVELVTVGQRRGMGHGTDGRRRFVTAVDVPVPAGDGRARPRRRWPPGTACTRWRGSTARPPPDDDGTTAALAQCSAHGRPSPAPCAPIAGGVAVEFASATRSGGWPPARRSRSTTRTVPTACSDRGSSR